MRSTGKGLNLDEFEVIEVRSGSASDIAGVKVGDVIVAINNIRSENLKLNDLMGYLSQKPGKKVKLDLRREGQRVRAQMILSDQI